MYGLNHGCLNMRRLRRDITLLEINGITLIKKWYNPVAPWYTIYGITN